MTANAIRLIDKPAGKRPGVTWPGGYSIRYLCADGETVCAKCANDDDFSPDHEEASWRLTGSYVNWEGPVEFCAGCNDEMESEYGDPDEDERTD